MAHNVVSAIYGGEVTARRPWHFAETGRDGRSKLHDGLMTTRFALVESGVADLIATRADVAVRIGDEWVAAPDYVGLVNLATGGVLGIHGEGYTEDQFADSVLSLVAGFPDDATLWEAMVLLREGKVFVGSMRLPDLDRILPDGSRRAAYIVVYSSHDASYGLTYKDASFRVDCENMLRRCDGRDEGRRVTIRHTAGIEDKKREAARIMTYAQERADAAERECAELLRKKITAAQVEAVMRELVVPATGDSPQAKASRTRAERTVDGVLAIFQGAPDLADCRGTVWAAVQAVGDWSDHGASYRGRDDWHRAERRLLATAVNGTDLAARAIPRLVAAGS